MCYYLNHVGTRNMISHCILVLDIFYRRPTSVHQFRSRRSLHIVVSSQRLFSKRLSMVVIHVFCTWYEVKNQGIKLLICLNYLPVEQIRPDGIARQTVIQINIAVVRKTIRQVYLLIAQKKSEINNTNTISPSSISWRLSLTKTFYYWTQTIRHRACLFMSKCPTCVIIEVDWWS